MDNWIAPKYNFLQHTIVPGGSQFTSCKGGQNKKSGWIFVLDKFTLQVNLGDKSSSV